MRIGLLGASRGLGEQVMVQALERGHDVIALARRPEAFTLRHPSLEVRKGDATDADSVVDGLRGSDLVISSLGLARSQLFERTTFYSDSGRILIEAMRRLGIERLLAVTSGGVEHDDPSFAFFYKWFLKPILLSRAYADMERLEAIVRDSDRTWTLVRPTALTDTPATGRYRVSPRYSPEGGTEISRADLAAFILDVAEQGTWVGGTPTVAY